jgi:hypothetical protein
VQFLLYQQIISAIATKIVSLEARGDCDLRYVNARKHQIRNVKYVGVRHASARSIMTELGIIIFAMMIAVIFGASIILF